VILVGCPSCLVTVWWHFPVSYPLPVCRYCNRMMYPVEDVIDCGFYQLRITAEVT